MQKKKKKKTRKPTKTTKSEPNSLIKKSNRFVSFDRTYSRWLSTLMAVRNLAVRWLSRIAACVLSCVRGEPRCDRVTPPFNLLGDRAVSGSPYAGNLPCSHFSVTETSHLSKAINSGILFRLPSPYSPSSTWFIFSYHHFKGTHVASFDTFCGGVSFSSH